MSESPSSPTSNPLNDGINFRVRRTMTASAPQIYNAWVRHFDTWFASPGEIVMRGEVGEPFWFYVEHDGVRYAHYGRFLILDEGRLIEMTWVTGRGGTEGAETIVRVELTPLDFGTDLHLAHGGFYDSASAHRHEESWPVVLEHLDETVSHVDN